MALCEVRIPTYQRPQLLKRALTSLVDQTYSNWVAIVMDDSPQQEAQAVVESIADERIHYAPNATQLGCAGNINRAFATRSLVGGHYACILEDDNWLLPTFLAENIAALNIHGVDLLLRNQAIWQQGVEATPTGRSTRLWRYTPGYFTLRVFLMVGCFGGRVCDRICKSVPQSKMPDYKNTVEHCKFRNVFVLKRSLCAAGQKCLLLCRSEMLSKIGSLVEVFNPLSATSCKNIATPLC
jgi:glycosyltransferase involved in cell wall biosynthesis